MPSTSKLEFIKAIKDIKNPDLNKKRNFIEKVELNFSLKSINFKKHKKISGGVKLPFGPRRAVKICMLADQRHITEAKNLGLYYLDINQIKLLKNKKKVLKKLVKKFEVFIASESLIKIIPRYLGPALAKVGKFPFSITSTIPITEQIKLILKEVKINFRKNFSTGVVVGDLRMAQEKVTENAKIVVSFLISLLKKKVSHIKTITMKRTMGRSYIVF
ncbi:ribosomal protein 10a (nucleomorph) [Bigelowiella natans]|uniref:Ribosomal protein 10a n=1 Tax=Bigelowiella natans TaxID=227086 RepID=Q3LW91_BIGNA|nr:ribosomal protein 10a [Bigelowiella natans]ABA27275.1 ribosomal protein 10a [Bigelowiella natans]|mmetsp:Transcript_35787/g.50131  ORF Transcript_35787/g.50131 Transcript_35787/m.50131 type:complete len:217 (+) Transcript_35787:1-651(+)